MSATKSKAIGKEICDILGLKKCRSVSITFRHDAHPRVVAVCLVDDEQGRKIAEAIKRFTIEPKKQA